MMRMLFVQLAAVKEEPEAKKVKIEEQPEATDKEAETKPAVEFKPVNSMTAAYLSRSALRAQ